VCPDCGAPFDSSVDGVCDACLGRTLAASVESLADPIGASDAPFDGHDGFTDTAIEKGEPAICSGCDEPLDPELDYCWTCQCEGQDWD
jgi:hypothetical protein